MIGELLSAEFKQEKNVYIRRYLRKFIGSRRSSAYEFQFNMLGEKKSSVAGFKYL